MFCNEQKKYRLSVAILIVVSLLICIYLIAFSYFFSKKQIQSAMIPVKVYSQYEILDGGKVVYHFDKDTISATGYFFNKYFFIPSCQGRIYADLDSTIWQNKYKDVNVEKLVQLHIDSLKTKYSQSKWIDGELSYYLKCHNASDEGFFHISQVALKEENLRDSTRKMLDSLKHLSHKSLKIVRHLEFVAISPSGKANRKQVEKLKHVVGNVFQLFSETLPEESCALSFHKSKELASLSIVPVLFDAKLNYLLGTTGTYSGEVDSLGLPHGHGEWLGFTDAAYYQGSWKHGKRDGFGFSVADKSQLRIGEWVQDKYKGERLVYSSDRIYGIDISKYQHVIKGKKYNIDWKRLRISHLGNISKKTINGDVNYPISFIYIKSTEGASLLNPFYRKDYVAARAHGYKVGSYHFFSTLTPATLQARQFLKNSYVRSGDLPPVLDVEPTKAQIQKMGGVGVLLSRMRIWLRMVEKETGKRPIIYVSQTFVNRYLSKATDIKQKYQVWIARYGEYKPDIKLVFWQLCPDGRVTGIRGHVDINVFNGYHDSFKQFISNQK